MCLFNTKKARQQKELNERIAVRKAERAQKAFYLAEASRNYDWTELNTDVKKGE